MISSDKKVYNIKNGLFFMKTLTSLTVGAVLATNAFAGDCELSSWLSDGKRYLDINTNLLERARVLDLDAHKLDNAFNSSTNYVSELKQYFDSLKKFENNVRPYLTNSISVTSKMTGEKNYSFDWEGNPAVGLKYDVVMHIGALEGTVKAANIGLVEEKRPTSPSGFRVVTNDMPKL